MYKIYKNINVHKKVLKLGLRSGDTINLKLGMTLRNSWLNHLLDATEIKSDADLIISIIKENSRYALNLKNSGKLKCYYNNNRNKDNWDTHILNSPQIVHKLHFYFNYHFLQLFNVDSSKYMNKFIMNTTEDIASSIYQFMTPNPEDSIAKMSDIEGHLIFPIQKNKYYQISIENAQGFFDYTENVQGFFDRAASSVENPSFKDKDNQNYDYFHFLTGENQKGWSFESAKLFKNDLYPLEYWGSNKNGAKGPTENQTESGLSYLGTTAKLIMYIKNERFVIDQFNPLSWINYTKFIELKRIYQNQNNDCGFFLELYDTSGDYVFPCQVIDLDGEYNWGPLANYKKVYSVAHKSGSNRPDANLYYNYIHNEFSTIDILKNRGGSSYDTIKRKTISNRYTGRTGSLIVLHHFLGKKYSESTAKKIYDNIPFTYGGVLLTNIDSTSSHYINGDIPPFVHNLKIECSQDNKITMDFNLIDHCKYKTDYKIERIPIEYTIQYNYQTLDYGNFLGDKKIHLAFNRLTFLDTSYQNKKSPNSIVIHYQRIKDNIIHNEGAISVPIRQ